MAIKLTDFLANEDVIYIKSIERESAIKEMCAYLSSKNKFSQTEIFEKVMQREDIRSTGIGHGLSVPHCTSIQTTKSHVILGVSHVGIAWPSTDALLIHVSVLIVVPVTLAAEKIHLLARTSKVFSYLSVPKILQCTSTEGIYKLITEVDRNELVSTIKI